MKEPDWTVTGVGLADPSVVPHLVRIEYGRGAKPHLSAIAREGREEWRVALSVARSHGTIFSQVSIEIARNVSENAARAFVETVSDLLKKHGRELTEKRRNTKHGELLVFSIAQADNGDDGAVFDRIDTRNALTPVVVSKNRQA